MSTSRELRRAEVHARFAAIVHRASRGRLHVPEFKIERPPAGCCWTCHGPMPKLRDAVAHWRQHFGEVIAR